MEGCGVGSASNSKPHDRLDVFRPFENWALVPAPEIVAEFAVVPRQDHLVDFRRAVYQAGATGVAVDPLQKRVL